MMGERTAMQEALFYEFSIERQVPADHLPRSIDRFVELSGPLRGADALHRRATEPHSFAIARAVQWVASCGGACVSRTTSAVLPADDRRLPGAGFCRAAGPRYRLGKLFLPAPNGCFDLPVAAMTDCVPRSSAVSRTIRPRQTCFWAAFRSDTIASSLRGPKPKQ